MSRPFDKEFLSMKNHWEKRPRATTRTSFGLTTDRLYIHFKHWWIADLSKSIKLDWDTADSIQSAFRSCDIRNTGLRKFVVQAAPAIDSIGSSPRRSPRARTGICWRQLWIIVFLAIRRYLESDTTLKPTRRVRMQSEGNTNFHCMLARTDTPWLGSKIGFPHRLTSSQTQSAIPQVTQCAIYGCLMFSVIFFVINKSNKHFYSHYRIHRWKTNIGAGPYVALFLCLNAVA